MAPGAPAPAGGGWGIPNRRYLGSFTPALTTAASKPQIGRSTSLGAIRARLVARRSAARPGVSRDELEAMIAAGKIERYRPVTQKRFRRLRFNACRINPISWAIWLWLINSLRSRLPVGVGVPAPGRVTL